MPAQQGAGMFYALTSWDAEYGKERSIMSTQHTTDAEE